MLPNFVNTLGGQTNLSSIIPMASTASKTATNHNYNYHQNNNNNFNNNNRNMSTPVTLSVNEREDKVKRYLDYCKNLQSTSYSSESLSTNKSADSFNLNKISNDYIQQRLPQALYKQNQSLLNNNNNNNKFFEQEQLLRARMGNDGQPQTNYDGKFFYKNNIQRYPNANNALNDDINEELNLSGQKFDDHFLLDIWLENKLQARFKQLNFILQQNCLVDNRKMSSKKDSIDANQYCLDDVDKEYEIFFTFNQGKQLSENVFDDENHFNNNFAHKPTSFMNNYNLNKQLQRLEYILSNKMDIVDNDETSQPVSFQPLQQQSSQELYCLVLTHPNSGLKRDSLIYSYPSSSDSKYRLTSQKGNENNNSGINKLTKLSGMFVTLFDMMHKIRTSPNETLSASNILLNNNNEINVNKNYSQENSANKEKNEQHRINIDNIANEYRISFVIENGDQDKINNTGIGNESLKPIIVLIAVPSARFNDIDARNIAKLLDHSLRCRFGSLSAAFSHYFSSNGHDGRIFSYLDKILFTLGTLLTSIGDGVDNVIGSLLSLSNTYPLEVRHSITIQTSAHIRSCTSLIYQRLFLDESILFNLCKYLNDYDSGDWIDESIQFYKDGNDIEQALSEHFARCLQFGTIGPSSLAQVKQTNQSALFIDNSHIFDLLEIELTFFTVLGSCLFYRGLLVKSHLPVLYFNSIKNILFTRGILAATKHLNYFLVYFTRFYPMKAEVMNINSDTDHFLLILGHGHFLHCSLIKVYRFDRNGYNHFNAKYSQKQNSNECHLQLPSSFAFYVFIKESFRLLHYYLNRFSLIDYLEDSFEANRAYTRSLLSSLYNSVFNNVNNNWLDKLNPFKSKKQTGKFFEINKIKDEYETNVINQCNNNEDNYLKLLDPKRKSLSIGSIYSQSTLDSVSFNYDSNYQFNRDYLPKTLLCFLNIEQEMETYYGPILGLDSGDSFEHWLTAVTSELCRQMNVVREKLNSMCQLEMERRQRNRLKIMENNSDSELGQYISTAKLRTARTIRLYIDFSGNVHFEEPIKSNCLSLFVYVIGRCDIDYSKELGNDRINNEFYACFQANPSSMGSSSTSESLLLPSKSNRGYSIGKLILLAENMVSSVSFNKQLEEKNRHYVMDQLDSIMVNLDDLIQNIRMENR